eukprot:GILJ01021767.1.p1 GENE.GILJ01021767.1~~GILJ01021767.1.p1  ORF type:complete len:561 (-),score=120.62 GILJ01021767.1:61-1743(-)
MHAFFQDVYVTDLKKQVEDANGTANQMRQRCVEFEMENKKLRTQLEDLEQTVKRYRHMYQQAVDQQSVASKQYLPTQSSSRHLMLYEATPSSLELGGPTTSTVSASSPKHRDHAVAPLQPHTQPKKAMDGANVQVGRTQINLGELDDLLRCVRAVSFCSTVLQVLRFLHREIAELVGAEKTTIFIVDDDLKMIVTKSRPKSMHQVQYVFGKETIDVFQEEDDTPIEDPKFTFPLTKLLRSPDTMVAPVQNHAGKLLAIVQLNQKRLPPVAASIRKAQYNKGKNSHRYGFSTVDADMTAILVGQVSVTLDRLYTAVQSQNVKEKVKDALYMARTISFSTSIEQLIHTLKDILPTYFGTERARIYLRDERTDELFLHVSEIGSDSSNVLRFQSTLGLTGVVANSKTPLVCNNIRKEPRFNSDVDGTLSVYTHNLLICPMLHEGILLGVVQLINKMEGHFNTVDSDMLQCVLDMAAVAVLNIRVLIHAVEISASIKGTLGNVAGLLEDFESSRDDAASHRAFKRKLKAMSSLMTDLSTVRYTSRMEMIEKLKSPGPTTTEVGS